MPLTDKKCKNAKPKDKMYKLSDSGGLCLQVMENGSKYWRLQYMFLRKQKTLSIGVYPETSLAEARKKRVYDCDKQALKTHDSYNGKNTLNESRQGELF